MKLVILDLLLVTQIYLSYKTLILLTYLRICKVPFSKDEMIHLSNLLRAIFHCFQFNLNFWNSYSLFLLVHVKLTVANTLGYGGKSLKVV